MTGRRPSAALIGGITLLERAINYTLGSLHLVTAEAMSYPTPCEDWDLRALLAHLDDSLGALHQAIDAGYVDLAPPAGDGSPAVDPVAGNPMTGNPMARDLVAGDLVAGDLVAAVRDSASRLLSAWANADGSRDVITIGDGSLTAGLVTGAGAIEIAVHGWDVAQSCDRHRPIPPSLAEEMLELSLLFVTDADRPARFAAPVDVPGLAGPEDRLVAFLGRHPHRPAPD